MQRWWLGLGAMVVVTALGSAGCARSGPEYANGAIFVSSQAGESVVVIAVGHRVAYLRRHSLENGALLASVQLDFNSRFDKLTCEPALPGRLWCVEQRPDAIYQSDPDEGLRVLDAGSLQTIAVQRQILGGTRELAGEPPLRLMRVHPQTRGFAFESRDGYAWIVDPTTLTPARFAGTTSSIPRPGEDPPGALGCSPSTGTPVMGGYAYSFNSETRKTLQRGASCTGDLTPLHPENTYLHGAFLRSQRVPILLDNPPRLLVVEDVVDHGSTLWSVLADGTAQWKVTNLPLTSTDAKLYRDMLVLVTQTMLVAVRTQDGTVVWTSPL